MDDCVEQSDGFRFIYTLPFERRRVLVEDTRFSNEPAIDRDECLAQVRKYLASIGVVDWSIQREEHGILPMPISAELLPGTNVRTGESTDAAAIRGGYAGGWFHAATGYSFPLAVAFAETIARATPEEAHMEISKLAIEHRRRSKFGRFLNRLLFRLVKPQARYQIFRRFYKVLSNDAIARFYSHRFTRWDAFRIVVGWPPGGLQPVRFLRSFFPTRSGVSMRSEAISTNSTMKESVL
jgi:lycopene beta-cyclase